MGDTAPPACAAREHMLSRTFPPYRTPDTVPLPVTADWMLESGFRWPFVVDKAADAKLRVPSASTFGVPDIVRILGKKRALEVIDCEVQELSEKMTLGEFADYFSNPERTRTLNVLSLEFSNSSLATYIIPPEAAQQLDWANTLWPKARRRSGHSPTVSRYCLMSAKGSYTDFHIDFGGSSVWYHVLHGQKKFLVLPPTASNIEKYMTWMEDGNKGFFADIGDGAACLELNAGQTLFIPSGWIHAVLTPMDSLVFGGNFIHSAAIEMQLKVYESEADTVHKHFRFPYFQHLNWYAAAHYLKMLRTPDGEDCVSAHINGEIMDATNTLHVELTAMVLNGLVVLSDTLVKLRQAQLDSGEDDDIPETVKWAKIMPPSAAALEAATSVGCSSVEAMCFELCQRLVGKWGEEEAKVAQGGDVDGHEVEGVGDGDGVGKASGGSANAGAGCRVTLKVKPPVRVRVKVLEPVPEHPKSVKLVVTPQPKPRKPKPAKVRKSLGDNAEGALARVEETSSFGRKRTRIDYAEAGGGEEDKAKPKAVPKPKPTAKPKPPPKPKPTGIKRLAGILKKANRRR